MNRETFWQKQKQHSLFPPSLFFVYLGVLFLMAGIHTGLIVGATKLGWSDLAKVYVPLFYWTAVAVILTLFTRRMIRKTYEEPMLRLAVPAFAGWIAPYFVCRIVRDKKTRQVNPFIEEKTEEIYAMCEKGQSLL